MRLSQLLFLFSFIFIISGCGYKPATYYTKKEIDGKVFVNLLINLEDPRNVVLIKDAMNEILVHRLGTQLVIDPSEADTILNLELRSVSMLQVQSDADGYSKVYKAVVSINVSYGEGANKKAFTVSGSNDFTIDSGTTISDTNRYQGIRAASNKALEEVVSRLAINSFKRKDD